MKIIVFTFLTFLLSQNPLLAKERRCGWLFNPTPSNWWLIDANDQWVLSLQGSHQATGVHIRNFESDEWMYAYPGGSPSYGYGCACLDVIVDYQTKYILSVENGFYQKLDVCKTDPHLPPPPFENPSQLKYLSIKEY
ncbi:hypothetical protein cce_5130 [Crocosphaera subtropica ATCC 51142]|uniref:DUF4087 domain-containing protein n=1 Tax=Crocosphaera subtropica (strain ATCC 51142 / BH68) TaxID=43989 RepID=B1X2W5_CROS5|nr:DUF4087 domain-containing protein [Crocosphaera subtropica]ACB54476.1 hypothetical protein cce_5130 [Crocosphaera subtropica ATCC 51142]